MVSNLLKKLAPPCGLNVARQSHNKKRKQQNEPKTKRFIQVFTNRNQCFSMIIGHNSFITLKKTGHNHKDEERLTSLKNVGYFFDWMAKYPHKRLETTR